MKEGTARIPEEASMEKQPVVTPESKASFDRVVEVDKMFKNIDDLTMKIHEGLERNKQLSTRLVEASASNPDNVDLLAAEIDQLQIEIMRNEGEQRRAIEALKAFEEEQSGMELESPLETQARMTAEPKREASGSNMEEALLNAAELHGTVESAKMEVENAADTTARLQEQERRFEAIGDMIQEAVDKGEQERAETVSKLETLNVKLGSMAKDLDQISGALEKAAAARDFESLPILAKTAMEVKSNLEAATKESEDLRAKLEGMGPKPGEEGKESVLSAFPELQPPIEVTDDMILESVPDDEFEKAIAALPDLTRKAPEGSPENPILLTKVKKPTAKRTFEEMSAEERMALTPDEVLALAEQAEKKPTLEEAKALQRNELTPDRKAVMQAEIAKLDNEIFEIKEGIELVDKETGKTVDKPGLKELESKLKTYGVDMNAIVDAKTDAEAEAAIKKSFSPVTALKRGLLSIFSPGYRKTMRHYEERTAELADAEDRLALSKLMIKDPKKYNGVMNRRLMKTMMRRAKQSRPQRPPGGLFSFRG